MGEYQGLFILHFRSDFRFNLVIQNKDVPNQSYEEYPLMFCLHVCRQISYLLFEQLTCDAHWMCIILHLFPWKWAESNGFEGKKKILKTLQSNPEKNPMTLTVNASQRRNSEQRRRIWEWKVDPKHSSQRQKLKSDSSSAGVVQFKKKKMLW